MNELKRPDVCLECKSESIRQHSRYEIKSGMVRTLYYCESCESYFSETKNTVLWRGQTAVSRIILIVNALTEGMGINAICRTFHVGKNTLYRWQEKFSSLKATLLLYALCHQFLQQIIEGDELYTKVKKTRNPVNLRGGRSS